MPVKGVDGGDGGRDNGARVIADKPCCKRIAAVNGVAFCELPDQHEGNCAGVLSVQRPDRTFMPATRTKKGA